MARTYDTLLDEDLRWTLFTIADTTYVAISGIFSSTATIYELTVDAATFLDAQTHGVLWCAGTPRHGYDTDDAVHWRTADGKTTFTLDALPHG